MGVLPERNNAQFQPLTIVLRNIIKEYPAGGGVLRELCQNADDAGASEIEFVLDRREHLAQPLLHPGLAEFHGASLLAFNDSVFTDVDFASLSRIGDSAKAEDLRSTGKFGRGFNSVYNWTDSPSILSRSSLLILDPHQTWSSQVGCPGGPVYNFVENHQEVEMRNQLSAFSSIEKLRDFGSEFHGTIIRLPLRTKSQAAKTKILPPQKLKPTTDTDIIDSFKKFAREMVETLLFLKNLCTITLRIDDEIFAKAESTSYSFSDAGKPFITLRIDDEIYAKAESTSYSFSDAGTKKPFKKADIQTAYERVFVEADKSCLVNLVMNVSLHIKLDDGGRNDQKFKFAISHHFRQGSSDNALEKWSRSQKLFPWVAIATPLEGYESFEGQLFSTLPLPIRTQHPAHIHGMFSITPDRNSIHAGGDWTISEDSEAKLGAQWNEWLLHECIPNVWVQNLEFVRILAERNECQFSEWKFWPTGSEREFGKLWTGILSDVFKRVAARNLELFPTICGTVGRRADTIFALQTPENLLLALQHAGVPMVIPPQNSRNELERLRPYTIGLNPLEPGSARASLSRLKDSTAFQNLSLDSRITLLHYVFSDEDLRGISSCTAPLVPLMDGTYASFDLPRAVFIVLARDDEETRLFNMYKKAVKTSSIPPKTLKLMRKHISNGKLQQFTKISAWEKDEVARYCMKYIFNKLGSHDTDIVYKDQLVDFINQLWKWISRHCKPLNLVMSSSLKDLFLLPLVDGEYRKLNSTIPVLDVSANRGIGAFLQGTAISHSRLHNRKYHLFTGIGFLPCVGESLRMCGLLTDYEDIVPLMTWLTANREIFVDNLSDSERILLLQHLNALSRSGLSIVGRTAMAQAVVEFCLFHEATPNATSERPWISIQNRHISYVGIKGVPIQFQAPGVTFIDVSNSDTEQIVTRLGLATCPSLSDLLETYVIPSLTSLDEQLRVLHFEYVLQNYHALSQKSKDDLSWMEIVPAQCSPNTTLLRRPIDIIASNSIVAPLYFEDENNIPEEGFYRRHQKKLHDLGIIHTITGEVITDRISEYGKRGKENYPLVEISAKAQYLITRCNIPPPLPQDTVRHLKWIPAQDLNGKGGLLNAMECRDKSREMLVKYIMPLVNFSVSPEWARSFGWDQPLQKPWLLEQLRCAVNAEDNAVIEHLIRSKVLEACTVELSRMKWIPSTTCDYYTPATIFFDDLRELSPHFGTLETRFRNLALFHTLGVQKSPSFDQFKELQDQLAQKGALEGPDLDKAIFIITEVGKRFSVSNKRSLPDFRAPDRHGRMRCMSELTAGDPGSAEIDLLILHPRVSLDTVKKLGISTFHDRYLELLNDPYFEGEFAQRESPTAFIEDTLKRYPIESTFNEYLANAEDCGKATKVSWILDAADNYPKTNLLSPDLAEVQGPALFCYNDGIFTEDDFRGIINIGVGSKGSNPSKIGKFGKGALTMYHWTSVPSFISGDHYVIFDPEQKYLPEHPRTKKRRAGMKFKIEHIREQCCDQLKPFEGVLGFDENTKSFPGTLFRFPLPRSDTLAHTKISIFDARKYLEEYYHEATTSLIFLKDIASISFCDRHSRDPVWSVSSKATAVPNVPRITDVKISRRPPGMHTAQENYSDRWCIISSQNEENIDIPSSLAHIKKKERLKAQYGLAALVPSSRSFNGRHFVGLQLQFVGNLGLPVHVNADIIIGSNRQSIPIREKEEGSAWNKWIYEHGIAPLYLDLVTYLMKDGPAGYSYWPEYPSKALTQNTDSITRTISAAFWELAASSSSALYAPDRLLCTPATHPMENLNLKAAVFNFLDSVDSGTILPLLAELGVKNVVTPNKTVRDGLKSAQLSSLNLVTPEYFLSRLHPSPARSFFDLMRPGYLLNRLDPSAVRYQHILLEVWAEEKKYSMDFFNSLLSFTTRGIQLTSLIGYALLPLANLTLGTFLTKGGNESFLVAETLEEQEILGVSQSLMVHPGLSPLLLRTLISSETLNIARFTPDNIARLRPMLEDRDVEYRRNWLVKVWAYLKNHPSYLYGSQPDCFGNMPMYLGKKTGDPAGEYIFFCPSDIESFRYPVVLEQSRLPKEVVLVLGLFKGLIVLDKSAFPESRIPQESITNVTGLYRLLKSIDLLASKSGLFIEDYISKTVPSQSIETLRSIFPPALLSELLRKYPSAKEYLSQFPIWPVTGNSQTITHQPATKALLPPFPKFSSLAMAKGDVFVESSIARQYSRELDHLAVKKMTLDNFLRNHVGICLGHQIESDKKPSYPTLLRTLFNESRESCSRYPIGVNGNEKFCMLDSLYDFDVPVFAAAFRDLEKVRFLHPEYRNLDVWQLSSLQKTITEDRYLDCARSIQRRGVEVQTEGRTESSDLVNDAKVVFGHLSWDTPDIRQWSASTWNQLSAVNFVPTQTVSTATTEHRKPRMQELSGGIKFTTLKEGILVDYTGIAWSQSPIFSAPPTTFVLSKISTRGVPTPRVVLNHLIFLSGNRFAVTKAQIPDYVKDVKACYTHLMGVYSNGIQIGAETDIWLNVEAEDVPAMSTDEFRRSWTSPSNLCLRLQYDSPPLQRIRSFLTPFQELLEYSGVRKLKGPVIPVHTPRRGDHSSLVLNGFQKLRSTSQLFDVKLVPQEQILEERPQGFGAHWSLLSAISYYLERMSASGMMEPATGIVKFPEMRSKTLSILLDYVYTGEVPATNFSADVTTELEDLIELFYAADQWQLDDLKKILEERLCDEHWIRPETVRIVLKCAQEVRAETVTRVCQRYISDNSDIVQREDYE